MDDEKENGEKSITERISDTVKNIVDTTSEAAMNALKTEEPKPGPAKETRGQVYVPEATDAVAAPAPLVPADPVEPAPAVRKRKRAAHKRAKKRVTKAKKAVPPKTAPKKSAKKSAKKAAPKKTAKKASKKTAKKSKKTKKTKRGR